MKINKILIGMMVIFVSVSAMAADPTISNVMVQQRWPWSRLVDIDFVLSCDATQRMDIAVSAYNGSDPLDVQVSSFSGDLYDISNGLHRIVWDPTVTSCTNTGILPKFRVDLAPSISPLYMVVDLSGGQSATSYPVSNYVAEVDVPGGVTNDLYKTTSLLLRRIPANTFMMGDSLPPTVPVTLTKPFYAGVYEVTQKQWYLVIGNWASYWTNIVCLDTRPVDYVRYNDIRGATNSSTAVDWPTTGTLVLPSSFMGRIRAKTGIEGFDLPTSAQWECLCRAGTQTYYNDGEAGTPNATSNPQMDLLGRYESNGGMCWDGAGWILPGSDTTTTGATAKVGSYLPNEWGLYDTHGNVWEWCLDWAEGTLGGYDPVGPAGPSYGRVQRGGSFFLPASRSRSASGAGCIPSGRPIDLGFRVVMTLP
ncbi:MAG: SUMF1/EgtB/PvdO family nonheme iron enzyme [Kiritimatiellia bacterium]